MYCRYVWTYASHGAQCGLTTVHSICCGCCVLEYHIIFRLFVLSSPSAPTLCLKDSRRVVDTIKTDFLLTVRYYGGLDCVATQIIMLSLKHVWDTISNKQTMFAFLVKRRKMIEREIVRKRCDKNDNKVSKVWDFEFL